MHRDVAVVGLGDLVDGRETKARTDLRPLRGEEGVDYEAVRAAAISTVSASLPHC